MGCDIHSYVEQQQDDGSWVQVCDLFPLDEHDQKWMKRTHGDSPFGWRSYSVFGFLADVRNYSHVPTIVAPRGLPDDLSPEVHKEAHDEWGWDGHSHSWLTVDELLAWNYGAEFEGRRTTSGGLGAVEVARGQGRTTTYRDFLGPQFFRHLDILCKLNEERPTRIVFWFDN